MPVFEYQGYDRGGAKATGIVDADSGKAARVKLRRQGILATSVTPDTGSREIQRAPLATLLNRITFKDISGFTRQLATLHGAGLTLVETLDTLVEQSSNVRMKKLITDVREQVSYGSSLADSLEGRPKVFDAMYVNLVRAGEASGALGYTLRSLADFAENRQRRRARIAAAMIYPALMTVVGCGVLLFLLGYVVPKTQLMFDEMGQALPVPTVVLLAVSNFISTWWPAVLAALALAAFGAARYYASEAGRKKVDRLALNIPLFGPVIQSIAIARFAGTLKTLLGGGVELVEALRITGKAVSNSAVAAAIDNAIVNITEGQTIARPLRESGLFPPVVTQMIAAGERSGELEEMLGKIADAYDFEVENTLSGLTSLVEPLLILLMGAVVGFVVLAILLPIFELSQIVR